MQEMKRIHMIGIGGIGLSALAGFLVETGKIVTGSDREESKITKTLQKKGVNIFLGQSQKNISAQSHKPDVVVYSLAIDKSNNELIEAKKEGVRIMSYPEAVGLLSRQFFTIAVSGTHGKSTVTAMIAKILIENNFDPSVIVGTKMKELGDSNYRTGKSKILVLEACEYMEAFLNYSPRIIVINSMDPDHLDYYRTYEKYKEAFHKFSLKLPRDGYLFANIDYEDTHDIIKHLESKPHTQGNIFTYGSTYSHSDYFLSGNNLIRRNTAIGELNMQIPGKHNRENALAAFAVCSELGIAPKSIIKSLNNYTGSFRRFEIKGKIGKTVVIDDYGHHPTEIKATLDAAREHFGKKAKICVVFQPHQYSRTRELLKEFGESFSQADQVIIPNIYEARDSEEDKKAVSVEDIVNEISKNGTECRNGNGLKETALDLANTTHRYTAIITMGAGDVWKIGEELVKSA